MKPSHSRSSEIESHPIYVTFQMRRFIGTGPKENAETVIQCQTESHPRGVRSDLKNSIQNPLSESPCALLPRSTDSHRNMVLPREHKQALEPSMCAIFSCGCPYILPHCTGPQCAMCPQISFPRRERNHTLTVEIPSGGQHVVDDVQRLEMSPQLPRVYA